MSTFIGGPVAGRSSLVVSQIPGSERPTTNDFFLSLPLPAAHSLPASPPATSSGLVFAPDPTSPDTPRRRGSGRTASLHYSPPAAALLRRRTRRLQSRRSGAGRRTRCNRSGRSGTSSPAPTVRVHCAEAEARRPPAARHRRSSRYPETSTPENAYAARDLRPLFRG